jgi:hypothetical protein
MRQFVVLGRQEGAGDIAERARSFALRHPELLAFAARHPYGRLTVLTGGAAYYAWHAAARRRAPRVPLLVITSVEARQLELPPGHPRPRTVYAGHPLAALTNHYFPVADFHRHVFEHKVTELLRMLAALGAKRIEVSASEGWGREMAANLDTVTPVKEVGGTLGKIKMERSGERGLVYRASMPENSSRVLPENLAWYPHERTWQELARQRLEHALDEFHLNLTYRDDFGITTDVVGSFTKFGLQLGGEFTRKVNTTWDVSGTF